MVILIILIISYFMPKELILGNAESLTSVNLYDTKSYYYVTANAGLGKENTNCYRTFSCFKHEFFSV